MTEKNGSDNQAFLNIESDSFDDMRDGEDIQDWPDTLGQVISYIHAALFEIYSEYNTLSVQKQKYHKIFACLAIFCGSVAIIMSIFQVFLKSESLEVGIESVKLFELISFFIAVVAVGVAFGSRMHKEWLKKRFFAEQCRSLKFRSLIHPYLWCTSNQSFHDRFVLWKKRFNEKVNNIKALDSQTLDTCLLSDEIYQSPTDMAGCTFDVSSLSLLTKYYSKKRLSNQLTYFHIRALQFDLIDRSTGWIPNFCFVASIICAAVHFGTDYFFLHNHPNLHFFSSIFLLLTLVFPIIAIGTRTLRSSVEVSRSAALFRAKAQALEHFIIRLDEELAKETILWAKILTILWQCENFFENENKEWLRMMNEAEWFL